MNPEKFAARVAIAVFAAGLFGLFLQRFLPEKHTTGPSRDMIGAVVGLLTLLCALVSGLLIWTAYGVYAGQNAPLLLTVVGWVVFLFCGFGLMSHHGPMPIVYTGIGAG